MKPSSCYGEYFHGGGRKALPLRHELSYADMVQEAEVQLSAEMSVTCHHWSVPNKLF